MHVVDGQTDGSAAIAQSSIELSVHILVTVADKGVLYSTSECEVNEVLKL